MIDKEKAKVRKAREAENGGEDGQGDGEDGEATPTSKPKAATKVGSVTCNGHELSVC